MIVFITSCGRPDLLEQTLNTFMLNNPLKKIDLIIHEDSTDIALASACAMVAQRTNFNSLQFHCTNGLGQHASIEKFLREAPDEKYFIHLEDDWEFDNSYDWISASIAIMEERPEIIKVLCRKDSVHPCEHNKITFEDGTIPHQWDYLQSWKNKGIVWRGFSWNPGVTRLDYLKKFAPFPQWEQNVAEEIWKKEFMTAELKRKIYTHIGQNRSTHE